MDASLLVGLATVIRLNRYFGHETVLHRYSVSELSENFANSAKMSYRLQHAFSGISKQLQLQQHDSIYLSSVYTD